MLLSKGETNHKIKKKIKLFLFSSLKIWHPEDPFVYLYHDIKVQNIELTIFDLLK